ncbi:hypothetical protein N656DRAFT_398392 [Canariomyces notabilis]|uniref:Uncharacterized protein n=1 Tax=Canariomyces notabilis TaxID=2074819 RepID=A0AAN6YVN6_9PEZI|nr:hypothetical protein N656DRAFT_398392 [Canariomyces arenarius]
MLARMKSAACLNCPVAGVGCCSVLQLRASRVATWSQKAPEVSIAFQSLLRTRWPGQAQSSLPAVGIVLPETGPPVDMPLNRAAHPVKEDADSASLPGIVCFCRSFQLS